MISTCQLLKNAVKDEQDGIKFYERLESKVDKDSRWKIKEILDDEKVHVQELIQITNRLNCNR